MSFTDCFKEFHEIEIDEHIRSLEKAGFRLEGCLKKKWLIRDQFCDVNLWALTAERICLKYDGVNDDMTDRERRKHK